MNLVDSSAWLEYLIGGKNAEKFAKVIEDTKKLLVPSIVAYEVFKKILSDRDQTTALNVVAHMKQGKIVDFDLELAINAARVNKEYNLPMADSIIYATAEKYKAELWTQDSDFRGMKGVKYFGK